MLPQLGENSLAEIHLSLSAIATGARRTAFRTVFVGKNSIGMDLIQWEMRAVGLRLLS
jgi:hypothetical protein